MFAIDLKITDLHMKDRDIYKIFFSMNTHQVATPEMMLEDAKSYVLFFRENKTDLSAYIALHLLTTNRKMFYSYSSNPFPEEQITEVEEEAFAFAEGLGAMLDDVVFSKLSDADQKRWIDEQDIFSKTTPFETQPVAEPSEPVQPSSMMASQALEPSPPAQQPQQPQQPSMKLQTDTLFQPAQPLPAVHQTSEPSPVPPAQDVQQIAIQPRVIYVSQPAVQPQPQNTSAQLTSDSPRDLQTHQLQQEPILEAEIIIPQPPPLQKIRKTPSTPAPQQQVPTSQAPRGETGMRLQARPESRPHQAEPAKQRLQQQVKMPTKQQQEIMQRAIKSGIAKPPLQDFSAEGKTETGLVSRDREALARLLTSF